MEIYAKLVYDLGIKRDAIKEGPLSIIVDNSYSPKSLYIINENDVEGYTFIKKVQCVINGHYLHNNDVINVSIAQIIHEFYLNNFVFFSDCSTNGNIHIESNIDYFQLEDGHQYLIDLDELNLVSEFKDMNIYDILEHKLFKSNRDTFLMKE